MRIDKKEVRTVFLLDHYECDWCGNEYKFPDDDYSYNIDIEYKKVYSNYGDYWVEHDSWKVDLCQECMLKLRKVLEDLGVKIQETGYY